MAFIDDLSVAIADAMRRQDQIRLVALRMLKAALVNREIDRGRALDDGEARQVVGTLVKQRKDSIEQFMKGGRQDLAERKPQRSGCSRPIFRRQPIQPRSNMRSSRPSPKQARHPRKTWDA